MLIDRPQITESSSIINAVVQSGTSNPANPSIGELFFRTDLGVLQVYNGTAWSDVSGTAVSSHIADGSLHLTTSQNSLLDGLAPTLTAAELNYVDGVTSPIQTQFSSFTTTLNNHIGSFSLHLTPDQNTFLGGLNLPTLTAAEVNHLIGVTSPIQAQLNTISANRLHRDGSVQMTGDLSMGANKIVSLATPQQASDAATKGYVDSLVGSAYSAGSGIQISDNIISVRNGNGITFLDGSLTINASSDFTVSDAQLRLAATTSAPSGTYGSSNTIPVITTDGRGRITAISSTAISGAFQPASSNLTSLSSLSAEGYVVRTSSGNFTTTSAAGGGITEVNGLPPAIGYTGPSLVFNTQDGKLYSYVNGAWEPTIPATTDVTDGSITVASFASGIRPVEIFSALPTTGNVIGRLVFLTTDGKLYRFDGTSWVTSVPAVDITGQLSNSQIASLNAAKITGELVASQISDASLTTAKFASGIRPVEIVNSLPTTGNFEGRIVFLTTDGKIYRYTGASFVSTVAAVDVTGQLSNSQIAALDAAKIIGQLTTNQIADATLTTAKFASSIKPIEIVSALPGLPHVEGRMVFLTTDDKLYRNTGSGWVASVASVDITGQLTSDQIADLAASKITGQLVASQIADAAITTAKFASGIKPVEIVSSLPSTGNFEGRIVYLTADDKLYRYTGTDWTSAIPATDISGQLTSAQISAIDAAKITGQLVANQIADATLTTAKFATGLRPVEIVLALPTTGNFKGRIVFLTTDNKLYRHDGTNWVASVASVDITGQLTSDQIADLAASKITGQLVASQIADAAITTAKFASGIKPVEIVNSLPSTGNFEGRIVYLTADDKLYRHNGTNWISAVSASDITGQLTSNQIADLAASKITGQLVASQIADASITTAKLATGINPIQIVSSLPTTDNFEGRIVYLTADDKLYRYNGTAWTAAVPAADITGQLTSDQIADLAASKITGELVTSQIADAALTTAKFASGIRPVEIVNSLPTTGNFKGRIVFLTTDNKMYRHDGTQFVSSVPAVDVTGQLSNAQIADIAAAKLTGQITSTQISDNAISTPKLAAAAITGEKIAADTITAANIAAGAITASELAANAVTAGKIAAGAVSATEIAADAITSDKIAAGAVTADELAANAVTAGKILAGTITGDKIAANTITGTNIAADTITAGNIAAGAITASELAANAVTAGKIAAGAVSATEIAADAITSDKIAAGAVTADELAANSVTAGKILAGTITGDRIAGNTITGANIAADTITASNIAAGAITASELAANAVTAGKISAGAVSATEIATDAITSDKIAAGAVTADELAANSVTAGKILAGTITGDKVAANTITGSNIAADTITASNIAAGAITASELAANAVTAGKIAAGAITANEIASGAVTTAKMLVSNFSNLIENPDFEAGQTGWTNAARIQSDQANAQRGSNVYTYTSASSTAIVVSESNIVPANPGEAYRISGWAKSSTGSTGTFSLNLRFYDAANNLLSPLNLISWTPSTSYTEQSAIFTAPASTAYFRVALRSTGTGTFYWDNISSARASDGNLIVDGAITAAKIQAGSITSTQIAADTITAANIATGAITATEIASGAVTTAKIAAGAITANELSANAVIAGKIAAGAISATEIATDAITSVKIAAGAVTADELAANAVTAGKILAGTITGDKVAANTITGANIAADTITANNIAAGAITASELAANAVTAGKIAAGAVSATEIAAGAITTAKLAAGAVTADQLAANSVTAGKILAGEITGDKIAANTITGSSIAADTITASNIAAGAITASELAANSVIAGKIAAGAISATEIAADAITSDKIAAGAVTADELAANSVTAGKILAGTITGDRIAANTITGANIAADTITANNIAAGAITASELAANSVIAGKIAAGAISATEIAANAIVSSNLAIYDFQGIVPNGNFQTGDSANWVTLGTGVSVVAASSAYTSTAPTQFVLQVLSTAQGNGPYATNDWQDAKEGDTFLLRVKAIRDTGTWTNSTLRLMLYRKMADGTTATHYSFYFNPTTSWQSFEDVTTALPANTVGVRFRLLRNAHANTANVWLTNFEGRKRNSAELIVDGGIVANQIATGAITADKLAANSVTAGKIAASSITADKVSISSLSSIAADLGTVTAGTLRIQSGATTPTVSGTSMTGAGAVINSTGNFAFGNSSTNISFNGSQMTLNGNVVATGNINLNAVTRTVGATYTGNSAGGAGGQMSFAIASTGGRILILAGGTVLDSTQSTTLQLRRHAGAGISATPTILLTATADTGSFTFPPYYDEPAAGTYTYEIYKTAGPGMGPRTIVLTEFKR